MIRGQHGVKLKVELDTHTFGNGQIQVFLSEILLQISALLQHLHWLYTKVDLHIFRNKDTDIRGDSVPDLQALLIVEVQDMQ